MDGHDSKIPFTQVMIYYVLIKIEGGVYVYKMPYKL